MNALPEELQAIKRYDSTGFVDERWVRWADYNALEAERLRLSDEVRRLREALRYQRLQVILMRKEGSLRQETMEHLRDCIDAALGSQP